MGCSNAKAGFPEDNDDPKASDKKHAAAENMAYQDKMNFLSRVPLMKRLPKDQHPLVASAVEVQEFQKGSTVITQGDRGDTFFVIRSGEASVYTKGETIDKNKWVAKLKPGDYFGENSLLRDEVRSATVVAEQILSCLTMTRSKFQELKLNDKLQFANRRAVGGGCQQQSKSKPPSSKTDAEIKLIEDAIRNNENLQTIAVHDESRTQAFIDVMWKEDVPAGTEIIKESDFDADYFYVVQEGCFEVHVSEEEDGYRPGGDDFLAKGAEREGKVVCIIRAGGSFGELALLYFVPRAATVKAKEKSVVWVIDRAQFKNILMKVSDKRLREYVKYLDGVPILQPLLKEEKKELAKALVEMHFTKGESIVKQGDPGRTFCILYDGHVSIHKDGREITKLAASPERGTAQYFGEGALLNNETRNATVQVDSPVAKALILDRDAFDYLLEPLKDIIENSRADKSRSSLAGRKGVVPRQVVDENRERILRKDLRRIGLLGCGGFGAVDLCEHKVSKQTFAMKAISKGYIVKTGMQTSVMNEKTILMMTNSPFIVKLHETYNGSQSLYFLLEPALGGELYATYSRKDLHGSHKHAQYYVAGTVLAFGHLHERKILYRDLKPENLLLTEEGHIKLTDMGLAKFALGKTYTACGTPDYFAPEVISSAGHSVAVDWWTLGVLIFELLAGHPPFASANPMQIYSKVQKGIKKVAFPTTCEGVATDMIVSLMQKEPSERLAMRPGGSQNVKNHAWYSGFDWKAYEEMNFGPPYKPVVKSAKDLANFSARKEDMPKQLEYKDPGTNWDRDFATA